MPIVQDSTFISEVDGDEYVYRGSQFRNLRTGRIASVKVRLELETKAVKENKTYGDSIFQDLMKYGITANQIKERQKNAMETLKRSNSLFGGSNIRADIIGNSGFKRVSKVKQGSLVCFFYNAKHRDTLKYWDYFPCSFVLELYDDGFLGSNCHYLDIPHRAFLFDAYMNLKRLNEGSANETLKIDYDILKSAPSIFKGYKPTLHRYLYKDYVKSPIVEILPEQWTVMTFLPTQQFQKSYKGGQSRVSESVVWRDSNKKL